MIFITIGTHPGQFTRLMKRIDEIAPKINEPIIIQTGFTKYNFTSKNIKSFDFATDLEPYFKKSRLTITHSATSLLEFVLNHKKPIITIPRQKKFREHLNDHQVEFAQALENSTGILMILDINNLTPELLKSYKKVPKIEKSNLKKLQNYFKEIFKALSMS